MSFLSKLSRQALAPWFFMLPALIFLLGFILSPIIQSIVLSFYRWEGFGEATWVGLENYRELWFDHRFWQCIQNNLLWFLAALIAPIFSLILALLLRQTFLGVYLIKSIIIMPLVMPAIGLGLVFTWFYEPNNGFLVWVLRSLFNFRLDLALLGDESTVTYAILLASLLPSISFGMMFFLTGLANLNQSLVESARLEGANKWRLFYHIVLPQLKPSLFLAYITAIVNSLRSFDLIFSMTQGGPYGSSNVLSFFMYREAIFSFRYGYGAAIACVLLSLTMLIIITLLVKSHREGEL